MATISFTENTIIKKSSGKMLASIFSGKKNITKVKKRNSNVVRADAYLKQLRELNVK